MLLSVRNCLCVMSVCKRSLNGRCHVRFKQNLNGILNMSSLQVFFRTKYICLIFQFRFAIASSNMCDSLRILIATILFQIRCKKQQLLLRIFVQNSAGDLSGSRSRGKQPAVTTAIPYSYAIITSISTLTTVHRTRLRN